VQSSALRAKMPLLDGLYHSHALEGLVILPVGNMNASNVPSCSSACKGINAMGTLLMRKNFFVDLDMIGSLRMYKGKCIYCENARLEKTKLSRIENKTAGINRVK